MTAHELAKRLLEMTDLEVAFFAEGIHLPVELITVVKHNYEPNEVEIVELAEDA